MSEKDSLKFVVFQGDAQLSVCSYVLMVVFGTKEKAIHAIMTEGEFDTDWLDEQTGDMVKYIKEYLQEHMQTPQCGLINYIIKEVHLNVWEEIS